MKRFCDPTQKPPPEPTPASAPAKKTLQEENNGFHLEIEIVCDPEVATPLAHARFEAYSDKLIHIDPYTIAIEKGRLVSIDNMVLDRQEE